MRISDWSSDVCSSDLVSSYTVYTSELDLDIEQTATGERVFEGTARAQSRTDRLQRIVPNLVEAMFTGFPGNSGETVKITIAPERSEERRVGHECVSTCRSRWSPYN